MMKLYRFLGKRGRITIPYEIRKYIGLRHNDILSFTQQNDGSVWMKREKICDDCISIEDECTNDVSLEDFLDSLSEEEQRDALVHLSLLWAEKQKH